VWLMSDPDFTTLKAYVNAASNVHDAFIGDCWDEAVELVGNHVGGPAMTTVQQEARAAELTRVPATVLTRAYLEVGAELYYRRDAPNGVKEFATPDGSASFRVARDPMVGAYPILAPYMSAGFA
jgi:hypothetical protein